MNVPGKVLTATGLAVVLLAVVLHGWWNTDVLGREEFCDGALSSADVAAVLDADGRLAQVSSRSGTDGSLHCTVERTSKFLGNEPSRVTVSVQANAADFAFSTRQWREPSAMSYFVGGATGAASGTRGWLLLPAACWDRVTVSRAAKAVPAGEVTVEDARSKPSAVAELAMEAARHSSGNAGCADGESLKAPSRLVGPVAAGVKRSTDPERVCGLPGLALPASLFADADSGAGSDRPAKERVTASGAQTWACDLYPDDDDGARITFTVSEDPALVDGVSRALGNTEDRGGPAVLQCADDSLYAGVYLNEEYRDMLLDQGEGVLAETGRELFRSLVTAVLRDRDCEAAAR